MSVLWSWLIVFSCLVYVLAAFALAAYGLHSLWLLIRFLRYRQEPSATICDHDEAAVLVQLPVYNERDVVSRLVAGTGALDWPRERLRIQLLDDSDDDTAHFGAEAIARLQAMGLQAEQVRRADRSGFKAGALEHGLRLDAAHPDGPAPFVAIFDADFVPPVDFLRRSLPELLADARCAFVQGRWEHLNPGQNLLTRAQAVGIDGHFGIEQGARAWSGLPLNFNGTCGIWRREAIIDAGGWQHDTLTEDLDLSYRAHLQGWHASYRCDLAVPGELPADIDAWRSQQFRWAKGSIQTAGKLLPTIWRSPWPLIRKLSATFHLTHYLVHPLILLTLLSAPVALPQLLRLDQIAMVAGLALLLCGMLPPLLLYAVSQSTLGRPWRRLLALPMLTAVGTGIAASNSLAVWQALRGRISPFVRTPKQGSGSGSYRAGGGLGLSEFLIASWGTVGLVMAWGSSSIWITPILAIYVAGFAQQAVMLLVRRIQEASDRAASLPMWPLLGLGLVAVAATLGMAWPDTSWREQPLWFATMALLLGGACFGGALWVKRGPQRPGAVVGILVVGMILQLLAIGLWHSDDIHRYAIEGQQILAGQNPYTLPPQAPEAQALVDAALFERVNHPEMTAIYPPLALLAHAGAQALAPGTLIFTVLAPWLSLVLLWAALGLLFRHRMAPGLIVVVAWNPVLVIFGSGEAHNDLLMATLVVLGLLAWSARRSLSALLALSAAMLCKPFAALLLPLVLRQLPLRRWWPVPLLVILAYLPFVAAGSGLFASLLTFGGGMHFHGAVDPWLRALLTPWIGDEAQREALIRVVLLALLCLGLLWLWRRRGGAELPTLAVRGLALLLLCLPTLHPWYLLAVVALLPFARTWALPLWTCTAGIYWLHGLAMLETGTWLETHWVTALAHTPAMLLMAWEAFGPASEATERARGFWLRSSTASERTEVAHA